MIPNDPIMLLSYVNTQLRDNYSSLEDLGEGLDTDVNAIVEKLAAVGYQYDAEQNKFCRK